MDGRKTFPLPTETLAHCSDAAGSGRERRDVASCMGGATLQEGVVEVENNQCRRDRNIGRQAVRRGTERNAADILTSVGLIVVVLLTLFFIASFVFATFFAQ